MIVFGTPAYFYSCTGQLKVLFDRTVAIYPDLPNKQYYYLLAQGDENKDTFAGTIKSHDGFLDCYEGSEHKFCLLLLCLMFDYRSEFGCELVPCKCAQKS